MDGTMVVRALLGHCRYGKYLYVPCKQELGNIWGLV